MAVSLFGIMRPIALFSGLGAACSAASSRGTGVLGYALAIAGALLAGVAAFWLAQIVARRLQPRRPSELLLLAFYVGVFLGIALAAFGGGLALLSLTAAV